MSSQLNYSKSSLQDNDFDVTICSPRVFSSAYVHNTYIILGSVERFRILGTDVDVRFVAVKSKIGLACAEGSSDLSAVAPDDKPTDNVDSRKFDEIESVTFSNLNESPVVYKISSTTVIETINAQSGDSERPSPPPSGAAILPIGLEQTCLTVIDILRQFSFSSWKKPCPEPTGLLLYGLQGCGKTRCLSSLATPNCVLNTSTQDTLGAYVRFSIS
ncbi:unnamed protein product [Dibothriocephalus latus]|uniref:Uncharacterized protein n=1 Tax=Dibothriocephalus latus TaxID=60516 RepID=A0A3P7LUV7_DIBLA|nr:unnamed protein product [Dibothriocephalus latus]